MECLLEGQGGDVEIGHMSVAGKHLSPKTVPGRPLCGCWGLAHGALTMFNHSVVSGGSSLGLSSSPLKLQ